MTRIKTLFGYLCIEDDRIAENAKTAIAHMFCEQDLNEIVVSSPEEQSLYRTANPFGCGYTNNYSRVIATHNATMKICGGIPICEIHFVETL